MRPPQQWSHLAMLHIYADRLKPVTVSEGPSLLSVMCTSMLKVPSCNAQGFLWDVAGFCTSLKSHFDYDRALLLDFALERGIF